MKTISKLRYSNTLAALCLSIAFTPWLATGLLMSGCAAIAPGNDPVVVNAERTTAVAADAFDTFLKSEYETRSELQAASPTAYREIHNFAEYLRAPVFEDGASMARAKQWLKSARRMTVVYKTNRTPENKANLQTILNTITAAVAEAQRYLLRTRAIQH